MAFFNNIVSRFLNAKTAGSLAPPYLNRKGTLQPPALVRIGRSYFDSSRILMSEQYADGTSIPSVYLESAVEIIQYVLLRAFLQFKKASGS